jgi:hypothetical protein
MYATSKMTDQEFLEFVSVHSVSGGCGTHGAEAAAAAQQSAFTSSLLSQAGQVFGADNGVFNTMKNAYSSIVNAGPSQFGFSAAQTSSMNAAAITQGANQTRGIEAMLGGKQAGAGGGNAPNDSGIGINAKASVAEQVAGQTSSTLNEIQQAGWAQGNKNWQVAGEGLEKAPSVFGNMGSLDSAAQGGLNANMANAQAADAASNWWVKPVEGAVMGGISAFTGGIGGGLAKAALGGIMGGGGSAPSSTNNGMMQAPGMVTPGMLS